MSSVGNGTRVWRVRWWIRIGLIAFWGVLAWQFYLDYGFVRDGEMDPNEIPGVWTTLACFALVIWSTTFRPYIAVGPDDVVLQGAIRRRVFAKDVLVEVEPTGWGLRFVDSEGRHFTSLVCQDTWARREPRWCDVAEAALGDRPAPWRGRGTFPSVFADASLRDRLLAAAPGLATVDLDQTESVWRLRRLATGTPLTLEERDGAVLVAVGESEVHTEAFDDESLARLLAVFGRGELVAHVSSWGWFGVSRLVDADGNPIDARQRDSWLERLARTRAGRRRVLPLP